MKNHEKLKVIHRPDIDYVSIDFKEGIEARSYFENGLVVREDRKGNILGVDITDSSKFFAGQDLLTMKEACLLLGISESTMRRKIKAKEIQFSKPNGKDFRFKKSDILSHIR